MTAKLLDCIGGELVAGPSRIPPHRLFNTMGRRHLYRHPDAALHRGSGVICAALISRYYLCEAVRHQQSIGFALMGVLIALILVKV